MKLQSAIEFLSVYAFALIVIATALALIFVFSTSSATSTQTSSCNSFGSVTCDYIEIATAIGIRYGGITTQNSLATIYIINSQAASINVSNIYVSVNKLNFSGSCAPSFMLPGEGAVCQAQLSITPSSGSGITGFYSVNALYCNAPPGAEGSGICSQRVSYGGSFNTYAVSRLFKTGLSGARGSVFLPYPIIISFVAAQANETSHLATYNSIPEIPQGYTVTGFGDILPEVNFTDTSFSGGAQGYYVAYALGTSGTTGSYFGITGQQPPVTVTQFPASIYELNSNSISCSYPYNSTFSLAYYTFNTEDLGSIKFNVYAGNAMAVYYTDANSWVSAFGNTLWPATSGIHSTSTISIAHDTNPFTTVAVEWSDDCGSGLQAFKMNQTAGYTP